LDRLTGMAVFVKVVDAASFAAAARHFGMSPGMVSRHVQGLEERLGVRLLNRTTRHVSATEVGQNYYERCLHILSQLEEADLAASELQKAPRGLLRITAPVSFGLHHLAPAISDYLAMYPEVSVEMSLDDPCVDLLEQRFDLAVRLGRLADSSLMARKLCAIETVLCASPEYLKKNGAPQTPADLAAHNCLVYTKAIPQSVWQFSDRTGAEELIHISGHFLSNSGDALVTLARKGAGVVLAPDYIVEDDLQAGRLVRLLPGYAAHDTPVYAVYPHSRFLSAKTPTFIDFLAGRFAHTARIAHGSGDGYVRLAALPAVEVDVLGDAAAQRSARGTARVPTDQRARS
jgi:DNA-binding transcriptional LysR family regulator